MLEKELEIYNNNLPEWLKTQSGKIVLIKDTNIIGFYNTMSEALGEGGRLFGLSSFLVKPILPSQEDIKIPALMLGILNANITHSTNG